MPEKGVWLGSESEEKVYLNNGRVLETGECIGVSARGLGSCFNLCRGGSPFNH